MANLLSGIFKRRDRSEDVRGAEGTLPPGAEVDPIAEALADREAEDEVQRARILTRSGGADAEPAVSAELAQRVSEKAFQLIVRHETGGRDYYEKVYKARPVWPGASSGVTIGFGYDLGYQDSAEAFAADWAGVLPREHVELLKPAVGLRSTGSDREEKIAEIKALLKTLVAAGVRIPWEPSEQVFKAVTVPRFAALTAGKLPGHDILSSDCFGALVSLTFNRGPSYDREHVPEKDRLDRFREMRGIKAALAEGDVERIPGLIRSMKRLWRGMSVERELTRRRENEARLFEDGLLPVVVAQLEATGEANRAARRERAATRGGGRSIRGIVVHDVDDEVEEELELEDWRRGTDFAREATRAASKVEWGPDDETPDYAHLKSGLGDDIRFSLRAADLEFLAELNSFPVDEAGDKPVLFGLRGCAIIEASDDEMDDEVALRDQRPDHRTARCVIGVWDRASGRIAVFPASTVPNAHYVTNWFRRKTSGNMLPTGFYRYIVGPHNYRPGCWLLRETMAKKHTVLVRRSSDDLIYDAWDDVSKSQPGDNLHPSFSSGPGGFNSAGCQVVVGQADKHTGNHRGPWAKFRRLAGLKTVSGKPGDRYVYMLLTGHEAMLAARAREEGATEIPEVRQSLMRLRFGSRGPRVSRLQRACGMAETGDFDVPTGEKLHELQQSKYEDASDGIFSPLLDAELKAGVFSDLPPDTVPPVAEGGHPVQPAPAQQPAPTVAAGPGTQPAAGVQPVPPVPAAVAAPAIPVASADEGDDEARPGGGTAAG